MTVQNFAGWPDPRQYGSTHNCRPVATSVDERVLEEDYEKLKLENLNCKQRCRQLEQLCHDLYRIAAHEGYISDGLHNRLVELGFAEGEQE